MTKVFGPFRLDPLNQCLWRSKERVVLAPKAYDVLRYLVERAGRLITQDEILEALWPDTYVNPECVRKYILEIRRVLGDQPKEPIYIETLPKRGYRFVADVAEERPVPEARAAAAPALNVVGRDRAIAELHKHQASAMTGQRQIVFITGAAGAGKTTLVDVFQEQAGRDSALLIARGQCIEGFGGTEAYYPVLEAIGGVVSRVGDNGLAGTLTKLAPTWLAQFPTLVQPEQRDWLQREILGSTHGRMVREFCEALEDFTMNRPLILILEDLHWSDNSTLDLISALARRREAAKLFVIASYRPVDAILSEGPLKPLKDDLVVRHLCKEVAIESLGKDDVADYLAREFAPNDFPRELPGLIHYNSGGNALFMVTILRDIVKQGLIVQREGTWTLTAPIQDVYPGIPETLQQLLDAQIERLSPEEQRILEGCSIAGEHFSVWTAAATLELSPLLIEETCDRLARRQQFVRSAGMQEAADGSLSPHYEFRHSLYRQALYERISTISRSKLHHRIAAYLMPFCTAGKRHLASDLALHFEEGRDFESAARCLVLTAENTASRFSHRASIQILRHALELVCAGPALRQPDLEIQILQRLGDLHHTLGEMSDAARCYESAADRAATAALPMLQLQALLRLTRPLLSFDSARGAAVCDRAVEVARTLADPLLLSQTQLAAAGFRLLCDWRKPDAEAFHQARETIRRLGGSPLLADVSYHLDVQAMLCEYREALEQVDALMPQTNNPSVHMLLLGAKLNHLVRLGRFGEVMDIIRTGKMAAEKNEEHPWMFIIAEAWLRCLCFDSPGLRQSSARLVPREVEHPAAQPETVAMVAAAYADLYDKQYDKALEGFSRVRNSRTMPGFFLQWYWRLHAQFGMAEARLQSGGVEDARREAHDFLEAARLTADPTMHALAWEINSRVARVEQDCDSARDCIEHALEIVSKFDIPSVAWRVYGTAGDLYRRVGEREKAREYRGCAQKVIQQLEASLAPEEPLRRSLLSAAPVREIFGYAAWA